jgi:hypothetical protein
LTPSQKQGVFEFDNLTPSEETADALGKEPLMIANLR